MTVLTRVCPVCRSSALLVSGFMADGGWLEGGVRCWASRSCAHVFFCRSCAWARREGLE